MFNLLSTVPVKLPSILGSNVFWDIILILIIVASITIGFFVKGIGALWILGANAFFIGLLVLLQGPLVDSAVNNFTGFIQDSIGSSGSKSIRTVTFFIVAAIWIVAANIFIWALYFVIQKFAKYIPINKAASRTAGCVVFTFFGGVVAWFAAIVIGSGLFYTTTNQQGNPVNNITEKSFMYSFFDQIHQPKAITVINAGVAALTLSEQINKDKDKYFPDPGHPDVVDSKTIEGAIRFANKFLSNYDDYLGPLAMMINFDPTLAENLINEQLKDIIGDVPDLVSKGKGIDPENLPDDVKEAMKKALGLGSKAMDSDLIAITNNWLSNIDRFYNQINDSSIAVTLDNIFNKLFTNWHKKSGFFLNENTHKYPLWNLVRINYSYGND